MADAYLDIGGAGEAGLLTDMPYGEAAPNAWTNGQNVRMIESQVIAFPGHQRAAVNPNLDIITSLSGVTNPTAHYWAHTGMAGAQAKAYAFDGTTFTDISPTPALSSAQDDLFIADVLNQNLVLTNGVDDPYFWPLNLGSTLTPLPGWTPGDKCSSLRAFKGFLIALDMTQGGLRFPYRVKWSDEAAPGGLPVSWDPLDPTVLAGEQDLGDTSSFLQNGLPLRDTFIIYSEKETIGMQLVGGDNTWRFYTISRQSGLLAKRAVTTLRGIQVAVTDGDVVQTNGQTVETIIDRKMRRWMFSQIDQDRFGLTFVSVNSKFNEVWVCFPGQGSDYCNLALVWNWRTGVWGVRDLPEGCLDAANGLDIVGLQTLTWGTNPFSWDNWFQVWDERGYDSTQDVLLLGGQSTGDGAPIFRTEVGALYDGSPKVSRVEKLGLRVGGEFRVTVHEVWPRALGQPFQVQVGSQEAPNGPVSWKTTQTFDPEQDRKITCRVSGRYPCVAFQSFDDVEWALAGFQLKYSRDGNR